MRFRQTLITLYTLISEPERIKTALIAHFINWPGKPGRRGTVTNKDNGHSAISLEDDSKIEFSINADDVFNHLAGMHNFFAKAPCKNKKLRESVLRQISVFNCMASCSFKIDDNDYRTQYIVTTIFEAAKDVNALVLTPDMRLFNADGKLVYSTDGKSYLEPLRV